MTMLSVLLPAMALAGGTTWPATSKGSCYDHTSHAITCDVAEADCGGSWYEPGKVGRSGCCHCRASCEQTGAEMHACMHAYYDKPAVSAGSCYSMSTHFITCHIDEADCDTAVPEGKEYANFYWYPTGKVGGSGCCHCKSGCAEADLDEKCEADDKKTAYCDTKNCHEKAPEKEEDASDDDWKSKEPTVVERDVTYDNVDTWNDEATESAGSCYDMEVTHTVMCDWNELDCVEGMKGVWYKPGHISSRGGGKCCHCKPGCSTDAETGGVHDDCNYYKPGNHKHYVEEAEDDAVEETAEDTSQEIAPEESGAYAVVASVLFLLD